MDSCLTIGRFSPKDKPSRALTLMCEVSRWGSIYGDSDKEAYPSVNTDVAFKPCNPYLAVVDQLVR